MPKGIITVDVTIINHLLRTLMIKIRWVIASYTLTVDSNLVYSYDRQGFSSCRIFDCLLIALLRGFLRVTRSTIVLDESEIDLGVGSQVTGHFYMSN